MSREFLIGLLVIIGLLIIVCIYFVRLAYVVYHSLDDFENDPAHSIEDDEY